MRTSPSRAVIPMVVRDFPLNSVVIPTHVGPRGIEAKFHDPQGPGRRRDDDRFESMIPSPHPS